LRLLQLGAVTRAAPHFATAGRAQIKLLVLRRLRRVLLTQRLNDGPLRVKAAQRA
jgi:hypothetical protein